LAGERGEGREGRWVGWSDGPSMVDNGNDSTSLARLLPHDLPDGTAKHDGVPLVEETTLAGGEDDDNNASFYERSNILPRRHIYELLLPRHIITPSPPSATPSSPSSAAGASPLPRRPPIPPVHLSATSAS